MIHDVVITSLTIVDTPGGNVLHAIKSADNGFNGFGEAYFSQINGGAIKAWKRHRQMTLNIIVPIGLIKFVIYDDREASKTRGEFQEVLLSIENYSRLTVPPMLWTGFQGISKGTSLLLNVANLEHDPEESDRQDPSDIDYEWGVKI